MANGGWNGTEEEWQRPQGRLLSIDPILEQFAIEHGFAVSKNHKDRPERPIGWRAPMEAFREGLPTLLADSFTRLSRWKAEPDQLEFATKPSPMH